MPAYLLRVQVERLARALSPTRILLFGSYAKGQQQDRSDADILVVTPAPLHPAMVRRARQLVAGSFPPIDLVFCTEGDIEAAGANPSPFLMSILGHALALYERRDRAGAAGTDRGTTRTSRRVDEDGS